MECWGEFNSPLGKIIITADEAGITSLSFLETGRRDLEKVAKKETEKILLAKKWLESYFRGEKPEFLPPLNLSGTDFQQAVWRILKTIPYGETTTYGEIARRMEQGKKKVSAQAVGRAVGRNKVWLIVPCHRVVGKGGKLVGYAGGLERKMKLLELEKSRRNR